MRGRLQNPTRNKNIKLFDENWSKSVPVITISSSFFTHRNICSNQHPNDSEYINANSFIKTNICSDYAFQFSLPNTIAKFRRLAAITALPEGLPRHTIPFFSLLHLLYFERPLRDTSCYPKRRMLWNKRCFAAHSSLTTLYRLAEVLSFFFLLSFYQDLCKLVSTRFHLYKNDTTIINFGSKKFVEIFI